MIRHPSTTTLFLQLKFATLLCDHYSKNIHELRFADHGPPHAHALHVHKKVLWLTRLAPLFAIQQSSIEQCQTARQASKCRTALCRLIRNISSNNNNSDPSRTNKIQPPHCQIMISHESPTLLPTCGVDEQRKRQLLKTVVAYPITTNRSGKQRA